MKVSFSDLLQKPPVILDGGWGTELQRLGAPQGRALEELNLTQPGMIEAVARSYVAAGSAIILTNTFGANRFALERHGLSGSVFELNRRGAVISRNAAEDKALVFGSMGPSGKMLMLGDVTEEELDSAFHEQALALSEGGVDGFVIETMTDLLEAKIALGAVLPFGLPVAVSMVFDSGPESDCTMMGVSAQQAAAELEAAGADIIGANCGVGIDGFIPVCKKLREATSKPIWIKPNAGLPEIEDAKIVYRIAPEAFAEYLKDLVEAGASLIGGCCGTTPAFIRALEEERNRIILLTSTK